MKNKKVSIVIATRNAGQFLEKCLQCIKNQSYSNIETIVVDGNSTDDTLKIAKKYKTKIIHFVPKVKMGLFDAPYKRNLGMRKATGEYVYWLDSDMELSKNLIREAVSLCERGFDALVLPEDSYGVGIWAKAKTVERRCYFGDSTVESPRFFKKKVWMDIGGFDESLGAGGDDVDLTQKLLEKGCKIGRTKNIVLNNEGHLTLQQLYKKKFMYGREMKNYVVKRPKSSFASYFPIRPAYIRNWKLFVKDPIKGATVVLMRTVENTAGLAGFIYSFFEKKEKKQKIITDYALHLPQYYGIKIPTLLRKYLNSVSYKTILDLGCGDGALLFALKKDGYIGGKVIYGVDLSPTSIKLVKKIDKKIHAYVDSAETLKKIKSNSIDFLISTHVVEHVDDKKMVKAVERVVRKGGTAYLGTVFKKPYAWYYNRRDGKWVMDITHLREYTADKQLIDLIDKKKFRVVENQKSQIFFPAVDFIARRLFVNNRKIFAENPILTFMRKISIPVPGYYNWELVLRKV